MQEEKAKSGFGTASLVLGIIAISTSFLPIINNMSFILGIIGAIMGIVSLIKKSSKGKSLWGIVLCILAIVITLNLQSSWSNSLSDITGESTDSILESNVDVDFGEFTATQSYGIYDTNLTVTVKNKSSEKKSFSIHIEAINSAGERIEDDYVYANDLNAGQSQKFEAFTFVSSDKVEEMKNATFKTVEVSMY